MNAVFGEAGAMAVLFMVKIEARSSGPQFVWRQLRSWRGSYEYEPLDTI